MSKAHRGRYVLKNPSKYLGDPNNIVYRSSWERKCMVNFDLSSYIIAWNSEDLPIPYISPKDGRVHRYFPDFIIVTLDENKEKKITMIEVKPEKEKYPPSPKGKKKPRFLQECLTYEINQAKWKAARDFCNKKGWEFVVMTEKHIF